MSHFLEPSVSLGPILTQHIACYIPPLADMDGAMSGALRGAIVGGIVGGIVGLLGYFLRKKK